MFVDLQPGNLREPITGRHWDRPEIAREFHCRCEFLRAHGLSRSDRVLMHYGNRLEFFVDLLAIWSLGGCAIPIDSRLTPFEVGTVSTTARPRFSLWSDTPDKAVSSVLESAGVGILQSGSTAPGGSVAQAGVSDHRPLVIDQEALILFTSGTTGQPKGVVHTHRSLRARWISLRENLGLKSYRRTLCLLPTHFGHGLICNCLFPWLSGQDLFILPPFRTDIIMQLGAIIDEHRITFLSSVPTVWRLALKMTKAPGGRTLERVHCGSAPLSAHLWEQVRQWTGTQEVFNAYGITETGSWVAGTTVGNFAAEDGLIGKPWGAVIRILKTGSTDVPPGEAGECKPGEQGYVWINTPALMKGYLGRDDLTDKVVRDGWFLTGDIGLIDDRGLLYLRGREREEINKGGMKIFPSDIDAVIERFEETLDVCTFGFEDPLYGEDVAVAVALKQSDDAVLQRLYAWTRRHLAEHQMPRRWYLLAEIPRTSRGKVSRTQVAGACKALSPVSAGRLKGESA